MKILMIAAAFVAVGVVARASDGAEKAKKPVVCLSYEVVRSDVAVCSDGKKPFLMRSFVEVQLPENKALVGYR